MLAPVNVAAYLYSTVATWSGVGLVESAAQRGRQRGDGRWRKQCRSAVTKFHTLRLGESLDPLNRLVSFLEQARGVFCSRPPIQLLRSS